MGANRIEQLIEDIYEFIESCKMQPLSQTKVIVPKDELYDLLDELRLRTPDEIKRYQKIIANRDAIMADAEEKSNAIQAEAREKAKNLVNENEIMQQAYYQANEMVTSANSQAEEMLRSANEDAMQIRSGALAYANEILSEVERTLAGAYDGARTRSEALVSSLKANLEIVTNNKKELSESLRPDLPDDTTKVSLTAEKGTSAQKDDYDFDENTFLNNIED